MDTVAQQAAGDADTAALPDPAAIPPLPAKPTPRAIRDWFDSAAEAAIPAHDGTLGTSRLAADGYARRAKADNTRRAYRAGVRAWCTWCAHHELPCLPANAADVVAFLAAERGSGLSVTPSSCAAPPSATCTSSPACRCPPRKPTSRPPWPAFIAKPPMPASCRPRSSPPPPTSCARSWPASR